MITKKTALAAAAFAAVVLAPTSASAVTIVVAAGNLEAFSYSVSGSTITINETWGPATARFVYLQFDDLRLRRDYRIIKNVTNNTGRDWTSFTHELGNGTPDAFIQSNDLDGLSFAQNSEFVRDSNRFATVIADELDFRDFIEFRNGLVADGDTVRFRYGIRARFEENQPFLLKQGVIPEPATWGMLILGFGMVGFAARRRDRSVTA